LQNFSQHNFQEIVWQTVRREFVMGKSDSAPNGRLKKRVVIVVIPTADELCVLQDAYRQKPAKSLQSPLTKVTKIFFSSWLNDLNDGTKIIQGGNACNHLRSRQKSQHQLNHRNESDA
jgi:hypothetical protein